MKTVVGIDFGTQSARAVQVDVETGIVLQTYVVRYDSMPGEDGLVRASDYDMALETLLQEIATHSRESISGLCVDATSLTLVPLGADGRALEHHVEFQDHPHALVKLWKRHTAEPWAQEALELAQKHGEPFLGRTGGTISSEWTLPKLLETRDEDPSLYGQIDLALDLCEYLTFRLTGVLTRSVGSMSYKGLWAQDLGLPSSPYLEALRPGLSREYANVMRGRKLPPGSRAGWLSEEWLSRLGLPGPVVVAAGVLDGHTSLVTMGMLNSGDAALVVGTSNVLTIQTESFREIEGICGIAEGGLTPGLWGIDSGQNCTGDMMEWFIREMLPASYAAEANARSVSPHVLLAEKIHEPWRGKVVATDWWNGSRNAPCCLTLPGTLSGLTLSTRPEDVYLALLQSIVCGTGEILSQCARHGVSVNRLRICGGAARKNRLLTEQYANLLDRPVEVSEADETPALGSALFAAVAAGHYASIQEAWEHMGLRTFKRIAPDPIHRAEYRALYEKNHRLRQALL